MITISHVVALSNNNVIGVNNSLPWNLKTDLAHFKNYTSNKIIVMGRKTYESIGRPLPKRRNIVITRQQDLVIEGCDVVQSLQQALDLARTEDHEPRIIGGATLYQQAFPLTTRLFLTEVQQTVEGDTFFPEWNRNEWHEVKCNEGEGVRFLEFERKS